MTKGHVLNGDREQGTCPECLAQYKHFGDWLMPSPVLEQRKTSWPFFFESSPGTRVAARPFCPAGRLRPCSATHTHTSRHEQRKGGNGGGNRGKRWERSTGTPAKVPDAAARDDQGPLVRLSPVPSHAVKQSTGRRVRGGREGEGRE